MLLQIFILSCIIDNLHFASVRAFSIPSIIYLSRYLSIYVDVLCSRVQWAASARVSPGWPPAVVS